MKPQYKLGMLASYIGFAISTLSGFILPPLLIAHLGQELNGLYNALTGFSVYFGMMDLGLGTAIIRYVAKYRAEGEDEKIAEYLYVMRNLYFAICGITLFLGGIFTYFVPQIFAASIPAGYKGKARIVFFFSLLAIVLTIFDNLYYSTIKAYEQFFISRSSAIMRVILRVVLIVLLLNLDCSVVAVAFADFLAIFLIMIYRMIFMKRRLKVQYRKPARGAIQLKEIFGFSAYVIVYSLTEKVFWQLDKVVLGIMAGGISVTIYTIGSQISSSISSVSSTVSSMYLPHAVKTSTKGKEYTAVMAQMARFQLFVIIPVFLGFVFFGKDFLRLWVGEGYDESYKIALVLIVTLIPVLLQSYGEALLKAINIQKVYASAMVVSVAANILLTVLLIPHLGAYGAALASAIVNILRCVFMSFYYQNVLAIGIIPFLKLAFRGMLLCTCITATAGLSLSRLLNAGGWLGLFTEICIFVAVYSACAFYYAFNDYELSMAKGIIRRVIRRKD